MHQLVKCPRWGVERSWRWACQWGMQGIRLCLAIAATCLPAWWGGEARGAGGGSILTNAAQVHELSSRDAAMGAPVRLRAVVTYFDPAWSICFVQDASSGLYIAPLPGTQLSVGQEVEVTGTTDAGGVLPIVVNASVRVVGQAPLPEPRRASIPFEQSASLDCDWTEIEGVLRSVGSGEAADHWTLELMVKGKPWRVLSMATAMEAADFLKLVDARIAVRGVAGVDVDAAQRVTAVKLFVPRRDLVRVITPAPNSPFERSFRTIASVQQESPATLPEHRVRIRGTVTLPWKDSTLVVEDDTGAIRVRCPDALAFRVDDEVEVAGFVAPALFSHLLTEAVVRAGKGSAPRQPTTANAARLLYGNLDGRLARLEGTVQSATVQSGEVMVTLHEEGLLFRASGDFPAVTNTLALLTAGSRVRLAGVCSIQGQARAQPQSFQLLMRSEGDLERLPTPPVFSLRQVLLLLGGGLLAGVAGAVWLGTLRARVKEQTEIIRLKLEREAALEQRYRHLLEGASLPLVICSLEDGALLYLNQRAASRLGLTPAAINTVRATGLFEQAGDWEKLREELHSHPICGDGEVRFKTADGQLFWALISANAIEFDHRSAALISLNDISFRKQAETERERLIRDLKKALASVNTLSGLLPICASCKKIRDDKGYWERVEIYVAKHSEATFTHGLCPDCFRNLYPDMADEPEGQPSP